MTPEQIDRFWSQVAIGAPDECWPWTGPTFPKGYGQVGVAANLPAVGAHRLAFWLTNGYLPPVVRHSCDNPPCCNPRDLLAGTQKDNIRDMHERGRFRGGQRPGSRNINAVLTEELVLEMRALRHSGVMVKDLAAAYGVSRGTASKAVTGKTWNHNLMAGR